MEQSLQLQALRWINLIICAIGVYPSMQLLRVAEALERTGHRKVSRGFQILALGFMALTIGNAVMFLTLLYNRAAQSLFPGYWMLVSNSMLIGALFAIYKFSQDEEDDDDR